MVADIVGKTLPDITYKIRLTLYRLSLGRVVFFDLFAMLSVLAFRQVDDNSSVCTLRKEISAFLN
jgi:hypothetical protein